MTRYGIMEDYEYNETHKRHRLVLWSGAFADQREGEAYSLPNGKGYMVGLEYGPKLRVECPAPRDDSNYREVDTAINAAVNSYYDNRCDESPDGKHQVTGGSCDQCGAKNFN